MPRLSHLHFTMYLLEYLHDFLMKKPGSRLHLQLNKPGLKRFGISSGWSIGTFYFFFFVLIHGTAQGCSFLRQLGITSFVRSDRR
jgi:hypothetical protein